EAESSVAVEVGVRSESPAGAARVQSSPVEIRIGDERRDPGQGLEHLEERRRTERVDNPREGCRDAGEVGAEHFLMLVAVEKPSPARPVRSREDGSQSRGRDGEEVGNHDVGKRSSLAEVIREPLKPTGVEESAVHADLHLDGHGSLARTPGATPRATATQNRSARGSRKNMLTVRLETRKPVTAPSAATRTAARLAGALRAARAQAPTAPAMSTRKDAVPTRPCSSSSFASWLSAAVSTCWCPA